MNARRGTPEESTTPRNTGLRSSFVQARPSFEWARPVCQSAPSKPWYHM